jgi:hypothetical protein
MSNDIFEKHRKAEKRENPHAFDKWLSSNCHHAIPHEKLQKMPTDKLKIVERIVKSDD